MALHGEQHTGDRYRESVDDKPVTATGRYNSNYTSVHPQSRLVRQLYFSAIDAVKVKIQDLSISVNTAPCWWQPSTYSRLVKNNFDTTPRLKTILYPVSAELHPGTITAIIGGSGSGKTTLLNATAERASTSRLRRTGNIIFNDSFGVHSVRHAYLTQTDSLHPTLTVRETLQYAADLRLPQTSHDQNRHDIVEEIIHELDLTNCASTRIGGIYHPGCSDGEKRRVSIGVQLLANPSVLFLDEPTTGLDAASAFKVVQTLKVLAQEGRTIIITIHQPRSEVCSIFDNLIILSGGSPVYAGSIADCIPWFRSRGYEPPAYTNLAEFLLDLCTIDNRNSESEKETAAQVEALKSAWRSRSGTTMLPTTPIQTTPTRRHYRVCFLRQIRVISSRTFKTTYRDLEGMAAAILEAIFLGLTLGYIFYDLPRDEAGIRSREGALFASAGLQGYLVLLFEIYRLTIDMPAIDREFSDNCLHRLPFIFGRRIARFPIEDLPVPLLFAVIVYFMAGLDGDLGKFFTFFAITIINHYIAMFGAMACVTIFRHFAGASLIANMIYTIQTLTCGMFIQSNTIPVYVKWLKWISYGFYIFGAYATNEFRGEFYDCPYPGRESNPMCKPFLGDTVLDLLGFPKSWLWRPILVSISFGVFFCAFSGIGLFYFPAKLGIWQARTVEADASSGKEKMQACSLPKCRRINVKLRDFFVTLTTRSLKSRKSTEANILREITVIFPAGELNVIMGPSGSGKSTLLNALALRLRNSVRTKYHRTGSITINEAVPSTSVLQSLVSYVTTEASLLPALTVRETLYFAARLRLPATMSKLENKRRAEGVLLKLGLKDCADNLIGNELIKGISGGEKRRVLIAVQLLADSRVLLLDEPTSGLDSSTAKSVIEVLSGLANEGRTIILTVHQASTDIFSRFSNALLLSRCGQVVYEGPARMMIEYFGKQGYTCPPNSNPADFVLDLITDGSYSAKDEIESSQRVAELCRRWKNTGSQTLADQGLHHSRSSSTAGIQAPAEVGAYVRTHSSFAIALPILLYRAMLNFRRQPRLAMARMQVVGLTIIFTLFFAPVHHDAYSIRNRVGFIQQVGAFYFVGMLQNVAIYPSERDIFIHESEDHAYGAGAFLAAYTIIEIPFEIISSLLFAVIGPLVIQLPRTPTMFFSSVWACFAIVSCGESVGIIFNTFLPHTGFAVSATGIVLSIANAMGGILSIDMPIFLRAVNYISPVRYALRVVATYSLRGVHFTCAQDQTRPDGKCYIETGEQVLKLYKMDEDPVVNIAGLAACLVAYRLVAFFVLKATRTRREMTR